MNYIFSSEYEIKVPFYDLDPMRVVWHGNYIKYMEKSRCYMLDKLGYNYVDMEHDSYAYPIAKMNTKYIKSATFNETILIKTYLKNIEPSINIKYEFYNKKNNEKIFEAETMQIAIDLKTGETLYVAPKRLIEAVEKISE